MYGFTAMIICDSKNTAVGGGVIESVNKTDECAPIVTIKHASGCPNYTANAFVRLMHNNPWPMAIAQMVIGLICAFRGRMHFPSVMGLVFGFLLAKAIVYKLAEAGYLDDEAKLILAFAAAVFAALITSWVIKKSIWLSMFFGVVGTGIALGAMTFAIAAYAINNGEVTSLTSY